MTGFDKTKAKLQIHRLWEKDWEGAIDSSDESLKNALKAQYQLVLLTMDIEDISFTYERASWLCLWNRLFKILEGLKAIVNDRSGLSLPCFERMHFEYMLCVKTIMDKDKIERLRAFFAWTLYHDLKYNQFYLDPNIRDGIWNIQAEKDIFQDKDLQEKHEALFIMDPENWYVDERKAKKAMLKVQDRLQHEIAWIQFILNDPELKAWYNKISELSEGKKKSYVPSFFSLFKGAGSNVRSRLMNIDTDYGDMEFAYSLYKSSSRTIHGSSLLENLRFGDELVIPDPIKKQKEIDDSVKMIGIMCYNILPLLVILKNHAWKSE